MKGLDAHYQTQLNRHQATIDVADLIELHQEDNMTHKSLLTKIWRYKPVAGYWHLERDCYREDAKKWLSIFSGDDPSSVFKASDTRPRKAPK